MGKTVQKASTTSRSEDKAASDDAAIPFIPAWELLEEEERTLSPEEAACVGVALWERAAFNVGHCGSQMDDSQVMSAWRLQGRLSGVSRRL